MTKTTPPQRVRGMQDMLGETAERFQHVAASFERVRRLYGFQRVEVPVMETTPVFARSLGETTDVVAKEMYSFEDRDGESMTLRPEFTAGIARAYLSEGWKTYGVIKLATHGPLFRHERPQAYRYRQFHQIDAEIIGSAFASADVELLVFADQLLKELGISDHITLQLNTLGDGASREAWRAALIDYFRDHASALSEESQRRLVSNPLRILDSKEAQDRPIADNAPVIDGFLTAEAQDFFGRVTQGLDAAQVAWTRDARLVRGLDYYRHTAFEFVTSSLGAQGTVLGGGRYDGLIESLGGPPTPGVGWAAGIERLAGLIGEQALTPPELAIVAGGDDISTQQTAIWLTSLLRRDGRSAVLVADGSVKKRYEKAQNAQPEIVLTVSSSEARGKANVEVKRGKGAGDISGEECEKRAIQLLNRVVSTQALEKSGFGDPDARIESPYA